MKMQIAVKHSEHVAAIDRHAMLALECVQFVERRLL